MIKTLKKALSFVLCLATLLLSTVGLMGISSSADIVKDESKKVMLLQENYKIREWEGEQKLLRYQNFQFNFPAGNTVIKENTTYVYTVEYYADPGEYDMGVNSSCVYARTNTLTSLGTAPKDMVYSEEMGMNYVIYIPPKGRGRMKIEFTTLPGQSSFAVGHMTGWDSNAYFWDFKLVEKGTTENLLPHENFYGTWQDYVDAGELKAWQQLGPESADGKGSYSFVPFNKEIANLAYGKILGGEEEEEPVSSKDNGSNKGETSSIEAPSDDISSNTTEDVSSQEQTPDKDNTITIGGTEIDNQNSSGNTQITLIILIFVLAAVLVTGPAVVLIIIFLKKKNK